MPPISRSQKQTVIQLNASGAPAVNELCEAMQLQPERLLPLVYEELKRIAARELQQERPHHSLQPTAIVHEAYLRMVQLRQIHWRDQRHFCGVAAHVIRRVLVDHERARRAAKRGKGARRVELDEPTIAIGGTMDYDLLAVNEAIERLETLNRRHAQIVELRFFAGLTIEETAALLSLSAATVKLEWRMARAWLKSQLQSD
ncbi:MAG: sigma-70 family RNA polymerase sigma factor [Planctomycetales bacterium]|nr:sigma-70 family RNA polymerase sigma factor [Planctomycetales bacterium]